MMVPWCLIALVFSRYSVKGYSQDHGPSSPKTRSSSVGEMVQRAETVNDLLEAATHLWLSTDDTLAPHLLAQQIHHEKRLRWSSHLLTKLSMHRAPEQKQDDGVTWSKLERLVQAAAMPFQARASTDRVDKEGRYLKEAVCGMHSLFGSGLVTGSVSNNVLDAIQTMFDRIDRMGHLVPLPDAIEMKWSCESIVKRLNLKANDESSWKGTVPSSLEVRTAWTPFDILPAVVDWEEMLPDAIDRLTQDIPFRYDAIVTRTGASVTERRGTAWIAESGIGALAYSGKLMAPSPIPPIVQQVMRHVETHVMLKQGGVEDTYPRPFFDCALCNLYPDVESACKFHTDPEHGSHWDRLTCVVATGEPRRFAFRPIPHVSKWSEWDPSRTTTTTTPPENNENIPASITLFPGDVVKMYGRCNDDFHHAVYADESKPAFNGRPRARISLVLKRAIARSGGQKGHGIAGEGRRSRRRRATNSDTKKTRERTTRRRR